MNRDFRTTPPPLARQPPSGNILRPTVRQSAYETIYQTILNQTGGDTDEHITDILADCRDLVDIRISVLSPVACNFTIMGNEYNSGNGAGDIGVSNTAVAGIKERIVLSTDEWMPFIGVKYQLSSAISVGNIIIVVIGRRLYAD